MQMLSIITIKILVTDIGMLAAQPSFEFNSSIQSHTGNANKLMYNMYNVIHLV